MAWIVRPIRIFNYFFYAVADSKKALEGKIINPPAVRPVCRLLWMLLLPSFFFACIAGVCTGFILVLPRILIVIS